MSEAKSKSKKAKSNKKSAPKTAVIHTIVRLELKKPLPRSAEFFIRSLRYTAYRDWQKIKWHKINEIYANILLSEQAGYQQHKEIASFLYHLNCIDAVTQDTLGKRTSTDATRIYDSSEQMKLVLELYPDVASPLLKKQTGKANDRRPASFANKSESSFKPTKIRRDDVTIDEHTKPVAKKDSGILYTAGWAATGAFDDADKPERK
ncbi:hypothetical protein HP546_01345 [Pseudomonas sp. CM25]|uniref:hypothetical protein n=1 Tax=unclassified Pseudomonas TaxID=196821 RepID=UPI000D72F992|nr:MULTISPECIES: hypothetical protein [unclassified Pseudomonas]NQD54008.1 hypothetical protein [Pseudomonas sp. CM25]PWY39056.1 hypothetical protein DK184_25055 [Pseudomonas sp. RW405]